MTQLLPDIFAIEVPEDVVHAEMYDKESYPLAIMIYRKDPQGIFKPGIPEPVWPITEGKYEILFTTKDCTEEQAGSVVERIHAGGFGRSGEEWKIYDDRVVAPRYATESLQSLLRSHNLTGKNYLLIKKQQP